MFAVLDQECGVSGPSREERLFDVDVGPPGAVGPGATRRAGGGQPSRRDSPGETVAGGQPATGRPISGTRCDRPRGRRPAWGARGVEPREGARRPDPVPGRPAFTIARGASEV